MKRFILILSALVAFVFASCTKEAIVEPEKPSQTAKIDINIAVGDLVQNTKAIKTSWENGDKINIWFDIKCWTVAPDLILTYEDGNWTPSEMTEETVDALKASNGVLHAVYEASNSQFNSPAANQTLSFPKSTISGQSAVHTPITCYSSPVSYTFVNRTLTAQINDWQYLTSIQVVVSGLNKNSASNYGLKVERETPYPAYCSIAYGLEFTNAQTSYISNVSNLAECAGGVSNQDGVAFAFTSFYGSNTYTFTLIDNTGKEWVYTKKNATISKPASSCLSIKIPFDKFVRTSVSFTSPRGLTGANTIKTLSIEAEYEGDLPTKTSSTVYSLNSENSAFYILDGETAYIRTKAKKLVPVNGTIFYGMKNVQTITGLDKIDCSGLTNTTNMFRDCSSLTSVDISKWKLSNVTDMVSMFAGCTSLQQIKTSSTNNPRDVTSMYATFQNCSSLTDFNASNWTIDNLTRVAYMFDGASAITSLDLSKWTVSTSDYYKMFNNTNSLATLKLNSSFSATSPAPTMFSKAVVNGVNPVVTTVYNNVNPAFRNCVAGQYVIFNDALSDTTSTLLSGKVSVSARKKVQFTRGNLYYNRITGIFGLEESQASSPMASGQNQDQTHVCTFYFAPTIELAAADELSSAQTSLFCREGSAITVEGISGLYALSESEFEYMCNARSSNLCKKSVKVGDLTYCFVIAPDDYTGTIKEQYSSLKELESEGLILLAGRLYRDGSASLQSNYCPYFWTSTYYSNISSYRTFGNGSIGNVTNSKMASLIRLVKTAN